MVKILRYCHIFVFIMRKIAPHIDNLIILLVVLSGLLHPSPGIFYKTAIAMFFVIAVPLLLFAFITFRLSENYGKRIQGVRKNTELIAKEIFGSTRAAFIVAFLSAWPIGLSFAGYPTGLVWTFEEMGFSWWVVVIQMFLGIVAIDAWTYWKHRLLHTKFMYPFHMHHHSFKDPTPFAGFAVGPVETILTFWPLLLICIPEAKHFAPFYYTAIISFVFLNFYLHSGVTFSFLEKILPNINLNSSAWHNIHHSDVVANYGEVSPLWDKICKTNRKKSAFVKN